jgi:hypothetical protein
MSRRRRLSGIRHGWPGAVTEAVVLCEENAVRTLSASKQHREKTHASERELRRPIPRANAGTARDARTVRAESAVIPVFKPADFTARLYRQSTVCAS